MTWGEFKKFVEQQGVEDTDELAWIECNGSARWVEFYEVDEGRSRNFSVT